MQLFEKTHWWYRTLHYHIHTSIRAVFDDRYDISIVDAGCGTGGLIDYLNEKGYDDVTGFDLSETAVHLCRKEQISSVFRADIRHIDRLIRAGSIDVVICADVLYFLSCRERSSVIQKLYDILRQNGILIINLPALHVARGVHDLAVGIRHRFAKKDIPYLLENTGFEIIRIFYWPCLLFPVILARRALQRLVLLFNVKINVSSDLEHYPSGFNNTLFALNRWERRLLGDIIIPGSSLFLTVKKSD
jgi:SAM-dependent methyltransferase